MFGILNKNKKKSEEQNQIGMQDEISSNPEEQQKQPFKFSDFIKKSGDFISGNKDIILPTAFSLGTGMGAVPGLMSGYSARAKADTLSAKLDAESQEILDKIKADKEKQEQDQKWKEHQNDLDRANALDRAKISHGQSNAEKDEADEQNYIQIKSDLENAKQQLMAADPSLNDKEAEEQAKNEMPTKNKVFMEDYEQRKYNMRKFPD